MTAIERDGNAARLAWQDAVGNVADHEAACSLCHGGTYYCPKGQDYVRSEKLAWAAVQATWGTAWKP